MDFTACMILLSSVWTCILLLKLCLGRQPSRLPPGPRPLPIIGNILDLGDKPHISLTNLSKTYGPVMSIKLGSLTTIVVSSSETAREFLQVHDQDFSGRSVPEAVKAHNHDQSSVAWIPASSPQWRKIRKIYSTEMFSVKRLDASRGVRAEIVRKLLEHVGENSDKGCAVDIGAAAFTASLNFLSNTVFSVDLADHHESQFSREFKEIVCGVMEGIGRSNLADYFPALRLIDPQGVRREMEVRFGKLFDVFDGLIRERLRLEREASSSSAAGRREDVLDLLLHLVEENDDDLVSTSSDIKQFLLDLFVAGTDTNSITIEWAMAELLKNPEKMAKAQREIREVVGNGGVVQESDISKLPYIQSIVKENFRLHPAAPLLVPHKAETNVEICGFCTPKHSRLLVNAWAIGRDPNVWTNPDEFVPERFMDCDIDVRGRHFELIPFGAGRRTCPGLSFAHRMVHLVLASLIHSYDWKLEDGVVPKDLDMSDKFGLTLKKAHPLLAIPIKVS